MSTNKLEIIKKYLLDNLSKGFIKSSNTSYIALVLFVAKPNRRLRFYINYQVLN